MIRFVIALATVLAFLMVAPVSAEDPPELVDQWAVPAGSKISGITVDASGNVFATGRDTFRVYTFDPNGALVNEWYAICPLGMGVDSTGYTYTGDQCESTVHRFKPDGSGDEEGSWISHNGWGVTVDHNDYVYVTDYGPDAYNIDLGGQVYKYDTAGNLLVTFGTYGSSNAPGEICNPHGVGVDKFDNVYITDSCNRVMKFDSLGNFITEWYGGDAGPFAFPQGVVVDSVGDVYVLEHGASRIQKFDSEGNFIVAWGGFNWPSDLALDSAGNLYVTDTGNELIKIFASPVTKLACIGFEPPMATPPVKVKKNRALPLKAEVFDADGYAMTDADFIAPPVVQVWFESEVINDDPDEVDALPAGQGDEGNQFVFTDDGKWQFNLKTGNYTASGTYTMFMESGDISKYVFEPICETSFIVKE